MEAEAAYMERVSGCLTHPQQKSKRMSRKRIFGPERGSPRWLICLPGNGLPVVWQKRTRTEHSWLGVLAANGDTHAQTLYLKHTKPPQIQGQQPYWLHEQLPPSQLMDQRYDFISNVLCSK